MMGLAGFGGHPALLGAHHHPYGDMGLPGMGHMGMGERAASAAAAAVMPCCLAGPSACLPAARTPC